MSDVIRVNLRPGAKFKITNETSSDIKEADDEDYFKHQLQAQYDKGFSEGQNAIKFELEQEYTSRLAEKTREFNNILASLEANLSLYDQAFDTIIIDVAIAIAEKVVKHEISSESVIKHTLRESIKKILGANEILIKINPKDHKTIGSEEDSLQLEETFSKIKFELDEKIEPGGCMVETEIGNVDSRISTQLSELKKQLENSFLNQTI